MSEYNYKSRLNTLTESDIDKYLETLFLKNKENCNTQPKNDSLSKSQCYLYTLNDDILIYIYKFLDEKVLQSIQGVCNELFYKPIKSIIHISIDQIIPWLVVWVFSVNAWQVGVITPCGINGAIIYNTHAITKKSFKCVHICLNNGDVESVPLHLFNTYVKIFDKKYLPTKAGPIVFTL